MKRTLCFVLVLALMSPAFAERRLNIQYSDQTENHALKNWLMDQVGLLGKLKILIKTSGSFKEDMSDLKDSLNSGMNTANLPSALEKASGEQRKELINRLPGMQPNMETNCLSLHACLEAPLIFHAQHSSDIFDGITYLARPWILLQKVRGESLSVEVAVERGPRLINFMLDGNPNSKMSVYAKPSIYGGYDLYLRGRQNPSELFHLERQLALARLNNAITAK